MPSVGTVVQLTMPPLTVPQVLLAAIAGETAPGTPASSHKAAAIASAMPSDVVRRGPPVADDCMREGDEIRRWSRRRTRLLMTSPPTIHLFFTGFSGGVARRWWGSNAKVRRRDPDATFADKLTPRSTLVYQLCGRRRCRPASP